MPEKHSHLMWILAELPRLCEAGIIPEDVKNVLEKHYRNKLELSASPQKIFTLVIGIIGIILISAGVILFLNHNWDMFPKTLRITLAFVPLFLAAVFSYFTLVRDKSQLFREISAILTATGTAAVIAMLSQIYHINGEFRDYMFPVLLLAAPLLYIFNSSGLAGLYVFFSLFLVHGAHCSWQSLVVLLLFLPFLLWHLRETCSSRVWFRYLVPVAAFSGLVCCSGFYYVPLPWALLCGILIISGCDLLRQKVGIFQNPCFLAGFFALILLVAIGSSDGHIFRIKTPVAHYDQIIFRLFTAVLVLIFSGVLVRRRLTLDRVLCLLLILLTVIPFVSQEPVMRVVFNCYFGVAGVAWLHEGFVKRRLLLFNIGAVMLVVLAVCRFFDSNIGVLYRSCGFLLLGAGFIVANALYLKRRAK